MDIARPDLKKKRRRRIAIGTGVGVLVLAVLAFAVSRLKPAAPPVDRSTIWTDTEPSRRLPAKISLASGQLEPRTRTMLTEIWLDNHTAGILPGTAATTPDEVSANYRSIIAVEPEQMNIVVKENGDPYSLLITKKPLNNPAVGGEVHKGGTVMIKGDDTDKCITGWLKGTVDKNACTSAAQLP